MGRPQKRLIRTLEGGGREEEEEEEEEEESSPREFRDTMGGAEEEEEEEEEEEAEAEAEETAAPSTASLFATLTSSLKNLLCSASLLFPFSGTSTPEWKQRRSRTAPSVVEVMVTLPAERPEEVGTPGLELLEWEDLREASLSRLDRRAFLAARVFIGERR